MSPQYNICSWLEEKFVIKIIILEQKTLQGLNYVTEDPQVDLLPPHPPAPSVFSVILPV